jgi:hypothetical protein
MYVRSVASCVANTRSGRNVRSLIRMYANLAAWSLSSGTAASSTETVRNEPGGCDSTERYAPRHWIR